MYILDSTVEASNMHATLNTAFEQGIVLLKNTMVTCSNVTFHKNFGSAISVIESEVHFNGKINFTANEGVDSGGRQSGGAVTSTLSVLTFNGKEFLEKTEILTVMVVHSPQSTVSSMYLATSNFSTTWQSKAEECTSTKVNCLVRTRLLSLKTMLISVVVEYTP